MNLQEILLIGVRIVVALGAAFAGWLLTGPLVRLLVRIAVHRPLPRPAVALFRIMGGILAGVLVYVYLPLGFGGGGWGFGPGAGGQGGGTGTNGQAEGKASGGKPSVNGAKAVKDKQTLTVEMLGGERVQEGKFYLLQQKEPAVPFKEVEDYIEKHRDGLKDIQIIIRPQSVSDRHVAVSRLRETADRYKLPSVIVERGP